MLRLLSRMLSLAVCGAFVLVAGSASALTTYKMAGSLMSITNAGGCAPCTVPVNGKISLDDDGLGNVTLTNVNLSHQAYQVGAPALLSVLIDRDSITLAAGPVAGTGATISSVVSFPATQFAQVGTTTCTAVLFPCAFVPLPDGQSPLTSPIPITLGNWTFDGLGNFTASITYTPNPNGNEILTLTGTPVPEPGSIVLVAAGLVGLAIRRRGF